MNGSRTKLSSDSVAQCDRITQDGYSTVLDGEGQSLYGFRDLLGTVAHPPHPVNR